ncbi:diacylglycerol/lipid kinase family protein [Specibacter sp. RAF43]|uniref:diacylglycerol/lipid kinase family protein n=1 Tax=Specibacter sp. RAF43 TaxID=3233057 RepID=UPI003F9E94D4
MLSNQPPEPASGPATPAPPAAAPGFPPAGPSPSAARRPAVLTIAVAINPRAAFGGRRGHTTGHIGELVVERLRAAGHRVTVLRRRNYAELQEAVESELAAGIQALVVVGGDGMVHLAVNALAGTPVPLGIVPAGTGNDTARGLGLAPDNPAAAVDRFLLACQGEPRVLDAARIQRPGADPVWIMGALSAGFDALVNERANGWSWPRGRLRYNLAILRELAALRPRTYSLVVDGAPREVRAVLISVANGPSIGGGMKITPEARYDDGRLDLFVVSPLSRLAFLRIYPRVFSGRHTNEPVVHIERVGTVSVACDGVVAYGDGERLGPLPVEISVVPGAVRVWV